MDNNFNNDDNTIPTINFPKKTNIKNEIFNINSIDQKPINEVKNQIIDINSIDDNKKPINEFIKDPNKKYKIKFSQLISELRTDSDKEEKMNSMEFTINLLLMSSQINQTNKISCLTLLS